MQQQAETGTGSNLRAVAVLFAMVVVIAGLIWAGVHNARSRKLAQQAAAEKEASKLVLVPENGAAPDAGPDQPTLEGKPAPGFSLVDLDGKKVSLSDYKGKPVLINFWATWCAPCKLEMPWFQEFSQKYGDKGLVILGVAADDAPKNTIAGTAKKLGVTYPVLLKDDKVTEAYGGIDYLPESFYVGRDGRVALQTAGMSDGQGGKDQIEANIRRITEGQ